MANLDIPDHSRSHTYKDTYLDDNVGCESINKASSYSETRWMEKVEVKNDLMMQAHFSSPGDRLS